MGLTPVITWAVTDPVMRAVITETQSSSVVEMRALSSAFSHCNVIGCGPRALLRRRLWALLRRGLRALRLDFAMMLRRGVRALRLGIAMMLRRRFQALRLGFAMMLRHGFRALRLGIVMMLRREFQALRLGITSMIFISLTSKIWTLLSDDLSSVIFKQPTEPPPKFSKLRGWLGWILKYFRFLLLAASSRDWTGNLLRYLELDLVWFFVIMSILLNSFEATRDDHRECLNTQSRPPRCSELVVQVLLNRGK